MSDGLLAQEHTGATTIYRVALTEALTVGDNATANVVLWDDESSDWVETTQEVRVYDSLNRFSGEEGGRFWVKAAGDSGRYEILGPGPTRSGITTYNTSTQAFIPTATAPLFLTAATTIGSDLAIKMPAATGIAIENVSDRPMLVEASWAVTLERTTPVDGSTTMRVRLREYTELGVPLLDPVPGCEGRVSTTTVAGSSRSNTCGGGPYLGWLDPGHYLEIRIRNFTGADTYSSPASMSHFSVFESDLG